MRTRITTLLAALAAALGIVAALAAAPASAAPAAGQVSTAAALATGGSGDFYKTDDCRPFATGPLGKVSNYDKGTGQELHYSTQSTVTWAAYRVYLSINGGGWIQLSPASEGYAYVSSKGATLTTKHVWRAWSGLTDSCTNVT